MNFKRIKLFVLAALFIFAAGCITHPTVLPGSEEWRLLGGKAVQNSMPKEVVEDSKAYIEKRHAKHRIEATDSIHYSGSTNGQHAVSFDIGYPDFMGEIIRTYVLIYDANHKRVKVVKYFSRRTLS